MNVAASKLKDFLDAQSKKDMLRFMLCGSVDDGKSTLIGRLLYDSGNINTDQLESLEKESAKIGTRGDAVDFALLTDGLSAEREQGITIDVAYRYFDSERRKYIVADTPGHEQYTRNMATAASNAGAAILLVDATKGLTTQTRRHAYIAKLMGVDHVVLAVNKMDLVEYAQPQFDEIASAFEVFANEIGLENISAIPLAATEGENLISGSQNMGWYKGPTLMAWLEAVPTDQDTDKRPFRFPVQWVNRPDQNFRGYAGKIASGNIAPGDEVRILPGGQKSTIDEIIIYDGKLDKATSGQAVTITLKDNIDISRGNIICGSTDAAHATDQLRAQVIWLDFEPMLPGRSYIIRSQSGSAGGSITKLRHKIDMDNLEHEAAQALELNEIGECNISLDRRIAFDSYQDNHATGGFIIIDRISNNTVGAGMIDFALMRADNLHWQPVDVDRGARSQLKGHKPCVLWFTGLSGSGKSTIANLVEKHLYAARKHTYLLDGDNVRHGLSRDLGFKDEDRVENIRRVGEVAKLMADAGLFVLVSFISPFRAERRMARNLMDEGSFLEVFVDAPIEVCEARDEKGLYKQARAGTIKNFTGIDSPYERPNRADIHIVNDGITPEEAASQVIDYLEKNGFLDH